MLKYDVVKKKSGFGRDESGKGKKMFAAIHTSYFYRDSQMNAPLERKEEWGLCVVYSDKSELDKNAGVRNAGLP